MADLQEELNDGTLISAWILFYSSSIPLLLAYAVIQELEKTIEQNSRISEDLVRDNQSLKSDIINLEDQNNKYREENIALDKTNQELTKEVESYEREIAKSRTTIDNYFNDIQQLEKENKELSSKYSVFWRNDNFKIGSMSWRDRLSVSRAVRSKILLTALYGFSITLNSLLN